MAATSEQVRCPGCQRPQPQRGPDAIYWCGHCRCQFDNDPLEGGSYSDRDPSWRLEREERLKQQKRNQRNPQKARR